MFKEHTASSALRKAVYAAFGTHVFEWAPCDDGVHVVTRRGERVISRAEMEGYEGVSWDEIRPGEIRRFC